MPRGYAYREIPIEVTRGQVSDVFSLRTADVGRYGPDHEFGFARNHCPPALTSLIDKRPRLAEGASIMRGF